MRFSPLFFSGLLILCPQIQAEEPARQWFKGNTHTHSLWSDGDDFPEMIVDWYRKQGYDFLGLSDHNILSQGEKWMKIAEVESRRKTLGRATMDKYRARFGSSWVVERGEADKREVRLRGLEEFRSFFEVPGKFLLIQAEEITDKWEKAQIHMNALNLAEVIKPQGGNTLLEVMRRNLQAARQQEQRLGQPILVHLNHPNFVWSLTAKDIASVVEEDFVEVYNGHPGVNHLGDQNRPGEEQLWDMANHIRLTELGAKPLFGLATDDSHTYHGGDVSPGRGWVMVHAESLNPQALIAAMRKGDFYASSGVILKELSFDSTARRLHMEIQAEDGASYRTKIIGARRGSVDRSGQVLATLDGTSVTYTFTGQELFVRASITSSAPHPNPSYPNQRKQAWTQPVGWRR